jgi:hypothetical protein
MEGTRQRRVGPAMSTIALVANLRTLIWSPARPALLTSRYFRYLAMERSSDCPADCCDSWHAATRRPLVQGEGASGRGATRQSDGGRNRDDLSELHRVDELPETRKLAVTDIPDVDDWQVQCVSSHFAGPRIADDRGDCFTGSDELLGYDREAFDVLSDWAKDLLRDGLRGMEGTRQRRVGPAMSTIALVARSETDVG